MRSKSRIAIICGGSSSERDVSLDSGRQVYSAINKDKYDVVVYDPLTDIVEIVNKADDLDFAFVILHGSCGEDGTIQGLFDLLGVPYQGSGVLGSAIAMNKIVSKRLFEHSGLPVVPYIIVSVSDLFCTSCCNHIEQSLGFPVVVKPIETGSSIGISIVNRKEDFSSIVFDVSKYGSSVLIEAYIEGTEVTCGVLGNDTLEVFPLVEIVPDDRYDFFNYECKYSKGSVQEICPARIPENLAKKAQLYAKTAHDVLFCRGYSRTDMILKEGVFYLLETNTIPGMTLESLYPKSALSMGISFENLVERLIMLGLEDGCRK